MSGTQLKLFFNTNIYLSKVIKSTDKYNMWIHKHITSSESSSESLSELSDSWVFCCTEATEGFFSWAAGFWKAIKCNKCQWKKMQKEFPTTVPDSGVTLVQGSNITYMFLIIVLSYKDTRDISFKLSKMCMYSSITWKITNTIPMKISVFSYHFWLLRSILKTVIFWYLQKNSAEKHIIYHKELMQKGRLGRQHVRTFKIHFEYKIGSKYLLHPHQIHHPNYCQSCCCQT